MHRPDRRALLGAAILVLSAVSAPALAAAPEPAVAPAQREAIESVIRDYLERNPEVVQKALQAIQAKEEAERARKQQEALKLHHAELVEDLASPVGGNPGGPVTIVEFFDYSCPHCKNSEPAVRSVMQKEKAVRVVYKELPILGPGSMVAARAALASMKQGKYAAMHAALMDADSLDEESVKAIAARLGLDVPRLLRDMQDPSIDTALERNSRLASELGIDGTPAFIVGGQLLPGDVDANVLTALVTVEKARASAAKEAAAK